MACGCWDPVPPDNLDLCVNHATTEWLFREMQLPVAKLRQIRPQQYFGIVALIGALLPFDDQLTLSEGWKLTHQQAKAYRKRARAEAAAAAKQEDSEQATKKGRCEAEQS